jgi:hypothetical protein
MHFDLDSHDAQATTEDDPTPILCKAAFRGEDQVEGCRLGS